MRTENRRRDREEKFMREPIHETAPEPDWQKIRPVLDEVMHELKETDREAILLRYFENRPFAEIGGQLGLNENAARMRVERALEKLRAGFCETRHRGHGRAGLRDFCQRRPNRARRSGCNAHHGFACRRGNWNTSPF